MVRISSVTVLPEFKLKLRFTDGAEGIADLNEIPRDGVFEDWNDPAFFAKVRLDRGVLTWPNGADLDPFVIYSRATGVPIEELLRANA
jgi:hypothetical protein